jgi:hypothetical protein
MRVAMFDAPNHDLRIVVRSIKHCYTHSVPLESSLGTCRELIAVLTYLELYLYIASRYALCPSDRIMSLLPSRTLKPPSARKKDKCCLPIAPSPSIPSQVSLPESKSAPFHGPLTKTSSPPSQPSAETLGS